MSQHFQDATDPIASQQELPLVCFKTGSSNRQIADNAEARGQLLEGLYPPSRWRVQFLPRGAHPGGGRVHRFRKETVDRRSPPVAPVFSGSKLLAET